LYTILSADTLASNIHQYRILAPRIARKAKPGQFVIVMVDEKGERIPLTIAGWDEKEGSITVVFNEVGKTTHKLASVKVGDNIFSFTGPLGLPAHIEKFGTVVCVVAGYSTATAVPIVKALKSAGNRVIVIIRAPSKDMLFGDERLGAIADRVIVSTGDGSFECVGFVLEPLKDVIGKEKVDRVFTAGPVCMMKLVANTTKPFKIPTIASLNPIMVDGTGMCGCCRVNIGGETKFACVDGPEFDAQKVDWASLMARRCTYSDESGPVKYRCLNCAQW
jgi:ferredoxin--NADP+ reductase